MTAPPERARALTYEELCKVIEDVMSMNHNRPLLRVIDSNLLPSKSQYPAAYLSTLSEKDLNLALRCIVVAFYVMEGREIPREHQVRAVLASYRNDSAIIAGTGSGKTLITALLMWMTGRGRVSITAKDFEEKYRIPTLVVNESTERTAEFWKKNVFDSSSSIRSPGHVQHLLVTPEQLFKLKEGYYSRTGHLIRTQSYKKFIARFFIDEAHFIHYAGLPHNTQPAFRPAYGRLDEIKVIFPNIPWHALTATAPPHVLRSIQSAVLDSKCQVIRYSSNRPNTVYAMHCVDGTLNNLDNYNMFLKEPFDFDMQPRVLLFFDNKTLCAQVRQHLMERLPKTGLPFPREEIVRFYRAGMSKEFLEKAHNAFATPDDAVKSITEQGIDYPDVDIVANVDIPPDIAEALQRGGRVVRCSVKTGLFLILYEEWVLGLDLSAFFEEPKGVDANDPDRPRQPLTDKSNRQDRVPYSMASLIHDGSICLRKFFADYLHDKCPSAMSFNGSYCCHRHDGFDLQNWIPGPI
ncbi:hypothetical protein V5O48_013860 [Marasmius crinis-equi]|uniref:DNA 3'-5' helicase n=1 Tax=Marasmius crinis-equi TaxID=585013 RepID=A0ABR3EYW5_9AGAR